MKYFCKLLISVAFLFILYNPLYANSELKKNAPILILGIAGQFDTYTGEILKAEGFNEFEKQSLTNRDLSLTFLKKFDLIILTEALLTDAQVKTVSQYVSGGGNLVAFRPDYKLASLFGIKNKVDTLPEAYISISPLTEITRGLLETPLQFHGTADMILPDGCQTIATLYRTNKDSTLYPAVVANNFGSGHAIAFLYNLPKSIAYTRQGNPAFAGLEKDGIKGIRAMDLFTNGWVDTSLNTLNQADEQMRLLSHCIAFLNGFKKPLPRIWYFPDTLKCLVTLTNDGEYKAEADFDPQLKDMERKGAHMALYILSTDKVTKAATDQWRQRGHEMSGHPDDTHEAEHPTWEGMNKAISAKLAEIKTRFDIPGMSTIVNHWFVWCGTNAEGKPDFTAQAKIEATYGIGMDINYAHYDNNSNQSRFLGSTGTTQGNFTGSGLPLKFATAEGNVVDIYQHFNNVYDQQYMENQDSIGFFNCFKGLMDRSLNDEIYSYISVKAHNDEYFFSKTPLLKMLDYAKQQNIPVWTPVKLLAFLEARNQAAFTNIKWSENKGLTFTIRSALSHTNAFAIMVPYHFQSKKISEVKIGSTKQQYYVKQIKGKEYALFPVNPGIDHKVTVKYSK